MSAGLTLYPLGGLGEIGMNCMGVSHGDSLIVVDCGLMFPEDYLFGVDVVIPRFDFIQARKQQLKAIVLTHGHEDHIGALPWLLPYVDVPIYGSPFTLGLVAKKLEERDLLKYADLRPVKKNDRVEMGPFAVNFFQVCHSIVDSYALGIETPCGRILHTGDFKIDREPMDDNATDLDAIKAFSEPGVLCMLSDSTNVEREGFSLNEMEIKNSLSEIFRQATGRIIITLFSSHIQRMREILELAHETGRRVAVSGKSLASNMELAKNLGHLKVPAEVEVCLDALPTVPLEKTVLLVTGSQGEPLSALSRLASGEHRQLRVEPGDLVIMSSRFIPGNVKAITKLIDKLYRLGAEVYYERVQAIHASGHAHQEELALMLDCVKPRYFVPVHGEYRHLVKHRRLAVERGVAPERALVIEDGQPLTFLKEGGIRLEDAIGVDQVYVDGKGVCDVGHAVLKERQLLAGEGMVVALLVLDEKTGDILIGPNLVSKGFVFEQQYAHVLEDAKCVILDAFEDLPPGNLEKLSERTRSGLRRFFRKVLGRDPVVVPLVISI